MVSIKQNIFSLNENESLSKITDEIYLHKYTKYGENLKELSHWNRTFLEFETAKDTFV